MCLQSFEVWRQDNNSTCLIDFCEAIKNVKKDYHVTECRKRNGNGNIIKMQYLERVFAYELYHQFRIKTEGREGFSLSGAPPGRVPLLVNHACCSLNDRLILNF